MAPPNRARKSSDDISKLAARRVPTRDGVLVRKVDVVDRDAAEGNEELGQNLFKESGGKAAHLEGCISQFYEKQDEGASALVAREEEVR